MYLFKKERDRSKKIKLTDVFWVTLSILYSSNQEMIFIQRYNNQRLLIAKRSFASVLLSFLFFMFLLLRALPSALLYTLLHTLLRKSRVSVSVSVRVRGAYITMHTREQHERE
jgi:hypothetical protein